MTADPRARTQLGLAGIAVVLIFTVVALSSALSGFRLASVSFTAGAAVLVSIASWTLVLLYHRVPRPAMRAAALFVAYLTWMFCWWLIAARTRDGLQLIMVQVGFLGAMLVAATARRVVGYRLDIAVARCVRFTSIVLFGTALLGAVGITTTLGDRVSAIVALVGLGWFLAEYRVGNRHALWWSVAVLLGIAVTLSRTAFLAGLVLIAVSLLLQSHTHRVRNLVLTVLLLVAGYWAVTSWAPLRERFTEGDVSLSVGGINLNASGRTEVWGVLWSEALEEPLLGHGTGTSPLRSDEIVANFGHPHNDYLRVFYEVGLVGLSLLAWFLVRTTRLLRHIRKRSPNPTAALAALNAGGAILIVMMTDNPIDYPFVMLPLGALIGLGLGSLGRAARSKREPRLLQGMAARTA